MNHEPVPSYYQDDVQKNTRQEIRSNVTQRHNLVHTAFK